MKKGSNLYRRIAAIVKAQGSRIPSDQVYAIVEGQVSAGALIEERRSILREITREVLRRELDERGRRQFENTLLTDEEGNEKRFWIQPSLMDLEEAQATVDQTARIGERTCRKANALAKRFNEEHNYGIQIPFPWLEEDECASN